MEGRSGVRVGDRHLADREPVHDAAAVVPYVVDGGALAGVERHAEAPFLPFDQGLVRDAEGWAFGLDHVERFEVFACALWEELRDVVGRLAVADDVAGEGLRVERFTFPACCRTVDTDDLRGQRIYDGDDRQWKRVEVGIGVVLGGVAAKAQPLEKAAVGISVVAASVGPGFDDDLKAGREVELG